MKVERVNSGSSGSYKVGLFSSREKCKRSFFRCTQFHGIISHDFPLSMLQYHLFYHVMQVKGIWFNWIVVVIVAVVSVSFVVPQQLCIFRNAILICIFYVTAYEFNSNFEVGLFQYKCRWAKREGKNDAKYFFLWSKSREKRVVISSWLCMIMLLSIQRMGSR